MVRRATYFIPALILLACSSDLGRDDAAAALHSHFISVSPHLSETLSVSNLIVEEIQQPEDTKRLVRFRTVSGSDTSGVLNATFVRSDKGWSLSEYGPILTEVVADMVFVYRFSLYRDLIRPLTYLGGLTNEWYREASEAVEVAKDALGTGDIGSMTANYRALLESQTVAYYRSRHTPTRQELEESANSDSLQSNILWGVYPDVEPVLVWVRDKDDAGRVCARPWDEDYAYADDFGWIHSDDFGQCVGAAVPYSLSLERKVILAIMAARRGVWSD